MGEGYWLGRTVGMEELGESGESSTILSAGGFTPTTGCEVIVKVFLHSAR